MATAAVIPNWYRKRPDTLDMNDTGMKMTARLKVVAITGSAISAVASRAAANGSSFSQIRQRPATLPFFLVQLAPGQTINGLTPLHFLVRQDGDLLGAEIGMETTLPRHRSGRRRADNEPVLSRQKKLNKRIGHIVLRILKRGQRGQLLERIRQIFSSAEPRSQDQQLTTAGIGAPDLAA